jgi:hypothetical protein
MTLKVATLLPSWNVLLEHGRMGGMIRMVTDQKTNVG